MDRAELDDWIAAASPAARDALSYRLLLRRIPAVVRQSQATWARAKGLDEMLMLRGLLTISAGCRVADLDVSGPLDRVRRAAADHARAITEASGFEAVGQGRRDAGKFFAELSVYPGLPRLIENGMPEIALDVHRLESGGSVHDQAVWRAGLPSWFKLAVGTAINRWSQDPDREFWSRWVKQELDGQPMDAAFVGKVALISDEIWHEGPAAVAAAIRRIERQHALDATYNAETVEPNPDTGLLRLVPSSGLPEEIGVYARRKMTKAVALFDNASVQQYGSLATDIHLLRQAVEDAANLPVELFDTCASASRRLSTRVANGECPPIEKDPVLADYQSRLHEVAADILAHDPQTQSVLERRNKVLGNTALIEAGPAITGATNLIVQMTEGHLSRALDRDAALASNPASDAEDRKEASYRWAGRVLRIGKWIAGTGGAIVLTREVMEAIPFIHAHPLYQQAVTAIYRWLGLG